jgi:RNA polymerase sigma-70 factor (ECF subfamily)
MKNDAELIRDARRDPDALGELYRRHAERLHSWLRSQVSPQIACELTAETFAQAALSLRRFEDRGTGSASPWLFGIAKNLLRRYYERERVDRGARRRLGMPEAAPELDVERVQERERAERIRPSLVAALATLPPGQRRALELRVIEELPYDEVASSLSCSEVAARIRVTRALGSLSERLKGAST